MDEVLMHFVTFFLDFLAAAAQIVTLAGKQETFFKGLESSHAYQTAQHF